MLKRILIGMIRFYRNGVSPWTPPSCRYIPTCSAYAEEAIRRHGIAKGGWLALRRLLRCHPFGGHGPDPVPSASKGSQKGSRRRAHSHAHPDPHAGSPAGAAGGER